MIICADDFGLRPEHDAAILELARAGRISAVSVMLAMPRGAPCLAPALRELAAHLDIGLHLVLTAEGAPRSGATRTLLARNGGFRGLGELARRAYCGQIRLADAQAEIQAQIEAFQECFGRAPDHLDGHLHVQQLPVVRTAVVAAAAELCRQAPCYVRHAWLPLPEMLRGLRRRGGLKRAAIAGPAGPLRRLLLRRAVPTNPRFFGVYDYRRWELFPRYFARFLAEARRPNDIIMTHPGRGEPWRSLEFATLRDAEALRPNRFRHAAPA